MICLIEKQRLQAIEEHFGVKDSDWYCCCDLGNEISRYLNHMKMLKWQPRLPYTNQFTLFPHAQIYPFFFNSFLEGTNLERRCLSDQVLPIYSSSAKHINKCQHILQMFTEKWKNVWLFVYEFKNVHSEKDICCV